MVEIVRYEILNSREFRVAKDGSHEYLMERWVDARFGNALRILCWKFGYKKNGYTGKRYMIIII